MMPASTMQLSRGTLAEAPPVQLSPVPSSAPGTAKPLEIASSKLPLAKTSTRDHRLDFWRGLCLIDMLLVHLVHQGMHLGESANLWIGEYTRFAAGGFVFIAGFSINRIFLPRARDPQRRKATYWALWKRAGVILLVHFTAEVGFLSMWPMFAGVHFRYAWQPVWGIVTLRGGYDLLPFYVVMVAMAPAMLELMRRGLWWILAAVSLGLFYYAHYSGCWATNSLPFQHDFYPILWQVIFVAGVLCGDILPKYDKLRLATKLILLLLFATAHIVLFLAYYGPNFGIAIHQYVPLEFKKVPLTDGEALRYLTLIGTIMIGSDLLWRQLGGSFLASFCERLGRNSLAVYVFHVWIVQIMVRASDFVERGPWRWVMAAIAVGMLWSFAYLLETIGPKAKKIAARAKGKPPEPTPPREDKRRPLPARLILWPVNSMTGLAAGTLACFVLVNYEQAHYSRRLIMSQHAMQSPVSDLLVPRDDQPLPDFIPDPDDQPDDEEEEPVIPKEPEATPPNEASPTPGAQGSIQSSGTDASAICSPQSQPNHSTAAGQ
jgi:hypothetical protein